MNGLKLRDMRFVINDVVKISGIGVMLELKTIDKGVAKAGELLKSLQRGVECRIKHFDESHMNVKFEFKNEDENIEKTCFVCVGSFKGEYTNLHKGDVVVSGV